MTDYLPAFLSNCKSDTPILSTQTTASVSCSRKDKKRLCVVKLRNRGALGFVVHKGCLAPCNVASMEVEKTTIILQRAKVAETRQPDLSNE